MDTKMSRFRFNLVYDGLALAEHRMDVRALAPALLAMSDLIERANEMINQDQAKVSVDVHASFREGSFGIDLDLAQSLWQRALDLAGQHEVTSIATMAAMLGLNVVNTGKGLVQLIQWIRGRAVKKVAPTEDGRVRFTIGDEFMDVEEQVYRLLQDYKIRKALQDIVREPLQREGIDTVSTVDEHASHVGFQVERKDAHLFVAPSPDEQPLEPEEYTATLQVLNAAFQDEHKWRFTEGGGKDFHATIEDDAFLQRIRSNEPFAHDDIIRARIRRTQRLTKDGLKADYAVIRVLEHHSASPKVQLNMDFDPDDSTRDK